MVDSDISAHILKWLCGRPTLLWYLNYYMQWDACLITCQTYDYMLLRCHKNMSGRLILKQMFLQKKNRGLPLMSSRL